MCLRIKPLLIFLLLYTFNNVTGQNYQDCENPFPICLKQTYSFKSMSSFGKMQDSLGQLRCSKELHETNSVWLKWKIKSKGLLTFFIDPINSKDDIDYVLFKRNGGCSHLTEVRCMASGNIIGKNARSSSMCQGVTGLSYQSLDEFEKSGCKYNSDNFLKYLSAEADEEYILFINNYDSSTGLSFTIDGDAILEESGDCLLFSTEQAITIAEIVPNPTSSNLTLSLICIQQGDIKTELFSINGKKLWETTFKSYLGINKTNIPTDSYPPGTYLIRVTQGQFSTIRQIVKI